MWRILAGLIVSVSALTVFVRRRRRRKQFDAGSVSDTWVASHRASAHPDS